MKHQFHILFALALLLGSLIIFQKQNVESGGQTWELPGLEHKELAVEIPALPINEPRIQPGYPLSMLASTVFAGKFRDQECLNPDTYKSDIKTQKGIFLELKPVLGFKSGRFLFYPPRCGDPPGLLS